GGAHVAEAAHNASAYGPYDDLFAPDGSEAITQLIAAIRERRARLAREWQTLSRARLSARGTPSVQLFYEVYVPRLRGAADCLPPGDGAAFVEFAHGIGAGVAATGMPFTALVAHVNLLKESCVNALADRATELRDALVALERIACCLVGAAADGYYAFRAR